MNVKLWLHSIVLAAALAAMLIAHAEAWAQKGNKPGGGGGGGHGHSFTIVPFDPPALPSTFSRVFGVNADAQVVGFINDASGQPRAVHLDTQSGAYSILSDGASAHGNNDYDQTVGTAFDVVAALWETPASPPTLLGTLLGDDHSGALDINNEGVIVGESASGAILHAAAWFVDAGAVIHGPFELPALPGHLEAVAVSVSEASGDIAIATGTSGSRSDAQAVCWSITINPDGSLTTGMPGGLGISASHGQGINIFADVCGSWANLPFIAFNDGTAQLLPAVNAVSGFARDINDSGDVVGQLVIEKHHDYDDLAILWSNGNTVDLNSYLPRHSGWKLNEATVITNSGVIGGAGSFDVATRGFVLIPN